MALMNECGDLEADIVTRLRNSTSVIQSEELAKSLGRKRKWDEDEEEVRDGI